MNFFEFLTYMTEFVITIGVFTGASVAVVVTYRALKKTK